MLCFNGGDSGGVDPRHLPGTDTDGALLSRIDNGVALHKFGHFPGKQQVIPFRIGGLTLGRHFQIAPGDHAVVSVLHQ